MPRSKGIENKKFIINTGVKDKLLTIRLTKDQYNLIKKLSNYYNSTITDYVLHSITHYARKGYHRTYIKTEELKDLEILEKK